MKRMTIGLIVALGSSAPALAKKPAIERPAQPELEKLLEGAGWTMTPEMSGAYKPGDIYSSGTHRLWSAGPDCFKAAPRESPYTSMEVRNSLESGVTMNTVVGGAGAGAGISKKIVFDDPMHVQLAGAGLTPNPSCTQTLKEEVDEGRDLSDMYVIVEVLSARIQKQECGSFDVELGYFVVSTDVAITQACSQESLEPVAVAYKIMPVRELRQVRGFVPALAVIAPTAAPTPPAPETEPISPSASPGGGGGNTMLYGGGILTAVGAGLVIKTTLDYKSATHISEDDWSSLSLMNSVGWGAMIAGGGMVSINFLSLDQPTVGWSGAW
jgi:hypothetical protein